MIYGVSVIDATSPITDDRRVRTRTAAIIAFPGVQALDVTGPYEVLAGANSCLRRKAYDVTIVASSPGAVRTESGLGLVAHRLPDLTAQRPDLVVVAGGSGVHDATDDEVLLTWLRDAGSRAERLVTVCSGTFLAASAGLLDRRRVTTHWARAERLAREHPSIRVDADPVYMRDGNVWSSAGVTAGIDLCLALVSEDHGPDVAQTVARWLVMFLHRPGWQSQFRAPVWVERAGDDAIRSVQERVDADPGGDHRIAVLARHAALSERHFQRRFSHETGVTAAHYVATVRIEAARRALERSDDTVAAIARSIGFGTPESMRRTFVEHLGTSPNDYRQRFTHTRKDS